MTALLNATDLSYVYPGPSGASRGADEALRGVSLELRPGEVVALLGPNGSGKSTLLRCLLGQLDGRGEIAWDQRPLRAWRRRDLARAVAYLPQSPLLDPEHTVADTLRLGRAPYWGAFGIESERDVQIVGDVARQLALDLLLDRRLETLSGGQRQRAFIGRCLAQEPRALLLDEPATHLDLRRQIDLSDLLRRLSRESGLAVLMASHDLNLAAAYADRLILLHHGAVAASGPAAAVLDPDLLQRVYDLPMQRLQDASGRGYVFPMIEVD